MGMFDKKKDDKPVVFKEDKKAAEARRKKALEDARKEGKEVKETRKGVQETQPKTERGRREKAAREQINKLSARGQAEDPQWQGIPPAGKRGSKGGKWD